MLKNNNAKIQQNICINNLIQMYNMYNFENISSIIWLI